MRFRPNPFTPGKRLTRPELFSGRNAQLGDGMQLIVQAAYGNAQHGLISGERGIGKSSLSSQVQGLARGDEEHLRLLGDDMLETRFNMVIAEHIVNWGESPADIVSGLMRQLQAPSGGWLSRLKVENLQVDLKIFKGDIASAAPPDSLVVAFVEALQEYWSRVTNLPEKADGLLLVIDEIDRIASTPGVASFLKTVTEHLSARGLDHICILLVGLEGVREQLKEEHPSVGRIFETIPVPLLNEDESMEIVTRALAGTGVKIGDDTNRRIAGLSGGFPNPIHLIGSEAFEADTDDLIGHDDLDSAIRAVVAEKWKDEFDADFIEAGYGKNREIIKAMGRHEGDGDVPLQFICDELEVTQPEISSNIGTLMDRDVIVRVDRGVYRFKDPLFRHYVRHLNVLGEEPIERRPRKRK